MSDLKKLLEINKLINKDFNNQDFEEFVFDAFKEREEKDEDPKDFEMESQLNDLIREQRNR